MLTPEHPEECDVVIVGARCAGSAAASILARYGRRVVVLDKASFPSDTLSTHVLFPTGVDELRRIGALERILALDPSRMRTLRLDVDGLTFQERFRPVGDIDYGICVPRTEQDAHLVAAARARGADVRERCTVREVLWEHGRAVGVRYQDAGGTERQLCGRLVVGADGRFSTVAAAVGAWNPYRASRNGRGMVFRYLDDPQAGGPAAETMWQWRDGDSIAFAFPCTPHGRLLVLFMGPREEAEHARKDGEGYWAAKLVEHPGVAERIAGARNLSRIRATADTASFFRTSAGPGWALIGDAGHFKDPVIGQGMRDAMWMGRTLAEHVLPVLDEPSALDRATRRWERLRDRECLAAYHFANLETRIPAVPAPMLAAAIAPFAATTDPDLSDLFQRLRTMQQVFTIPDLVRAAGRAIGGAEGRRGPLLREAISIAGTELGVRAELLATRVYPGRVRGTARLTGEHPGARWPAPPRTVTPADPTSPRAKASLR